MTCACVLFVDFSSAINTLEPHLLIEKLTDMSVDPSVISWINSFMTNRPKQVRIGNTFSKVLVTNTGALQGCVLSPMLFTTYTDDNSKFQRTCTFHIYIRTVKVIHHSDCDSDCDSDCNCDCDCDSDSDSGSDSDSDSGSDSDSDFDSDSE